MPLWGWLFAGIFGGLCMAVGAYLARSYDARRTFVPRSEMERFARDFGARVESLQTALKHLQTEAQRVDARITEIQRAQTGLASSLASVERALAELSDESLPRLEQDVEQLMAWARALADSRETIVSLEPVLMRLAAKSGSARTSRSLSARFSALKALERDETGDLTKLVEALNGLAEGVVVGMGKA